MKLLKLILLALVLYIIRFYGIGLLEQTSIFQPMHAPMSAYPDCFGFTMDDLPMSHLFNYGLWLSVVFIFHLAHPSIEAKMIWRSLLIFGICGLFFVSLTGAYMNHFNDGIRVFFRYAMLDALLLFGILGLTNGLLYPVFFRQSV